MAGFKNKDKCPCDSPLCILVDGKVRYFPCCVCGRCRELMNSTIKTVIKETLKNDNKN